MKALREKHALIAAALLLSTPACSGGGGNGKPTLEIVPPSATVISEVLTSVSLLALVDGEPGDVQWVLVGPGSITVTEGPETHYRPPYPIDTDAEPLTATVYAFASGAEATAAMTINDSIGVLTVAYDNYPAAGYLYADIIHQESFSVVALVDGPTSFEAPAGSLYAEQFDLGEQYVTFDRSVEGEYTLATTAPVTLPDDGQATLHIRWEDGGTGLLWLARGSAGDLLGLDGTTLLGLSTDNRAVSVTPAGRELTDLADAAPGTGLLWASDSASDSLVGFDSAVLGSSGTYAPSLEITSVTVLGTASLAAPISVAVDEAAGELWYANSGNGTFGRFALAGLGGGMVAPTGFFLNAGRVAVSAIAVDVAGDVWLADSATGMVHRFASVDLATSGTPTPAATFTGPATAPVHLEFDVDGNLWIAEAGAIYRVDAAQLAATGATLGTADLTISGAAVVSPQALHFNPAGDLFIADAAFGVYWIPQSGVVGAGTYSFDAPILNGSWPAGGATAIAFRRH